jgi:polysulfide reductase chain C
MGLQESWGPLLAWDLFLGGAGAGAYLIAVIALWLGDPYRRLARPGIYVGPILVALGALLLLIELGQPLRFWRGFLRPYSSVMSIGMILISLFIVLGFVHILGSRLGLGERLQRWLGSVNALFGLGIMVYTGLLLGMSKGIPFWNTPLLPMLFVFSALATGAATLVLLVALLPGGKAKDAQEETKSFVISLGQVVTALLVMELIAVFSLLFLVAGSRSTTAESVQFLLAGGYAVPFWLGVVLIGLLVPLVLVIWVVAQKGRMAAGRAVNISALAATLLLVGGVVLRYAVVAAGAKLPLVQ